jgi:hypothetical protein
MLTELRIQVDGIGERTDDIQNLKIEGKRTAPCRTPRRTGILLLETLISVLFRKKTILNTNI